MYTDERVKEITTDLYYDLLDKYVSLSADHKKAKSRIKELELTNSSNSLELAMYKNHSFYPHVLIGNAYRSFIKQVVRIMSSCDQREAILKLRGLDGGGATYLT